MLPVDQMMKLVELSIHDPGGDRSQTIKLLPVLIDRLRAEGYSFVPVSELGGFSRDQVMPKLPWTVMLSADRAVFLTLFCIGQFLYYCFIAAIVLGIGRLVVLGGLAIQNRLRNSVKPPAITHDGETVSVLIPAYNEEKVIAVTVERIL